MTPGQLKKANHDRGTALGIQMMVIFGLVCGSMFHVGVVSAAGHPSQDTRILEKIQKDLRNKKYDGITVAAHQGVVTLSGQVNLFATKLDAQKIAKKTDGVQSVQDNLVIAGPQVPDQKLQQTLLGKIQMDRVGFGQVFDAITVQVQKGVVILGGHAVDYPSQNSAVSLAEFTPGVQDVVNKIQVDPLSPMDDRIRMAEFAAIYNYSPLSQYAMDPMRPIRISVQNGNVTLYGVVNSKMDQEMAGLRANQVSGVFHVTNDLQIPTPAK